MTVSIGSRLLYRSFFRAVPLPEGVKPAGVKATGGGNKKVKTAVA